MSDQEVRAAVQAELAGLGAAEIVVRAAELLIRQHMALADEGIGPKSPKMSDAVVLAWAFSSTCSTMDEDDLHEAWDFGLMLDEEHIPFCTRHGVA